MEINEAVTGTKAIYLQAATLAGFDVSSNSPEMLAALVRDGFGKVENRRRPEAVANLLRLMAATLEQAQETGQSELHEASVEFGMKKICPVYPFD